MQLPEWIQSDVTPADSIHFCNDQWGVGSYRAKLNQPEYRYSGPFQAFYIVFPLTFVRIRGMNFDFTSTPSQINCYRAGAEFTRVAINNLPDHGDYFFISPAELQRHAAYEKLHDQLMNRSFICPSAVYFQQRRLIDEIRAWRFCTRIEIEIRVLGFIGGLLNALLKDQCASVPREAASTEKRRERIEDVKTLIAETTKNVSLRKLAAEVGVTPWYLSREFRRHTGLGLHQYIVTTRLHQSLALVRETTLPLTRVAHELGFSHHSHFTSAFSHAFGRTPSAERAKVGSPSDR